MYDAFYSPPLSDSEFDSKPMVMLVGQYSTGKTSVRTASSASVLLISSPGLSFHPAFHLCSPAHTLTPDPITTVHPLPHRAGLPGAAHRARAHHGPLYRRDGRAGGKGHPRCGYR